tara:strand:+ start:631 stop:2343 length:1713 start_codon:yes stop_codon:yes gene_type:complete
MAEEEEGLFSKAGNIASSVWDQMTYLDKAALGTAFVPVVGDVVGAVADGVNWYNNPEDRTWTNAGLMVAGLLPFVPPAASKRAWELTAQNMPNDLKGFYSGPIGQVGEIARSQIHGAVNAVKQAVTPSGQALFRTERISKTLQNELTKAVDALPKAKQELIDAKSSGDKIRIAQASKAYTRLGKVIAGQKSQSYLFGEQYGKQVGPLKIAARGTHIGSGKFNYEDFSRMVDDVADIDVADKSLIFKAIGQLQNTSEGVGKMVMKKAKSSLGAGDLSGVVSRGPRFRQVSQLFTDRPSLESFGNFSKFEKALMTGASKTQKNKITKRNLLPRLKKAFHGNKELTEARTIEGFTAALKKSGINDLTGIQIKHAFSKLPRQGFKNNKELIDAMDSRGIQIMNREKALAGDPVLIQNHLATGAFELGNANVVSVVRPNGSTLNFLSDKNDLAGINAPFGGNMITVSTPINMNLAGGVSGKVAARRTKAFNKAEFAKTEEAARAVQKQYNVDPFSIETPTLNVAQKASTKAIIDAAPKATTKDYLNAAGVGTYIAGSGAARSGLFAARQGNEEEK